MSSHTLPRQTLTRFPPDCGPVSPLPFPPPLAGEGYGRGWVGEGWV
jgi:hypothetical protein